MTAGQLGCPVGTIHSRLATARERLRRRLTHRGVAPTVIPVDLLRLPLIAASEHATLSSSVPVALANSTVRGALRVGPGAGALAEIVSAEAVTLMEGVLKTMVTTKLMLLTTTVLVAGLVLAGGGVAAYSALGTDDNRRGRAESRSDGPPETERKPTHDPEAGASLCKSAAGID